MVKRTVPLCFLLLILCVSFLPCLADAIKDPWWNSDWSYRQQLFLPIDTSVTLAGYQPIDTTIVFKNPCWAPDEHQYSIRVIVQGDDPPQELESQIYDLNHSDATHIASCNLVFLIPGNATGTERYYVYYDGSETAVPDYPDRVSITDAYSEYEPIPGYAMKSHYYKISQDGYYVYTITQDAYILWYTAAQLVTKGAPGATEILPKYEEMTASFDFAYYYGPEASQMNSTSEIMVSKQILVDGNLMVCCRLNSRSKGNDLETTAIYKYYYCPTPQKRIQAHIIDTTLQDCHVYPGTDTDGTYVTLQSARLRSSIEELNGGTLYPYLHVYTEANTVEEYPFDLTPESNPNQRVTRLITATDDVDLGSHAWASLDEGNTTGAVHAVLFRSTSVVKAGANERDGIQLKAFESAYPHVPGLSHDTIGFECTRNTYEAGEGPRNLLIPKGFRAEFDAEFFSSPTGGYHLVEHEVPLFRALVAIKPTALSNTTVQRNETKRNSLTVVVYHTPAFPFGAGLSLLTGHDFPFITVELYKEDERLASGTAGRLPLEQFSGSSTTLFGKLVAAARVFDLRNLSLLKKIRFQYLEPGEYLVKVFKDNSFLRTDHQFIGYTVVTLKNNKTVLIGCTRQGSGDILLTNQEGNGIPGAQVTLSDKNVVVARNVTNDQGNARLLAPCGIGKKYTLQIYDQGFLIDSEQVPFPPLRAFVPLRRSLHTDEYNWGFTLIDTWGLPLAVNITPQLSSDKMKQPTILSATQQAGGQYLFTRLPTSTYRLQLQYKAFRVVQNITIPASNASYVFPAAFPITFQVVDTRGLELSDATLQITRSGTTKTYSLNSSSVVTLLPPGHYMASVISQKQVISQRPVTVSNERTILLITTQEPLFPLVIIIAIAILEAILFLYAVRKKDLVMLLVTLAACLAAVACMLPWWSLTGSTPEVTTSSTLYLTPPAFVTTMQTASVLTGELSFLPDIFITVILMILVVTALGGLLCGVSLVFQRRKKHGLRVVSHLGAVVFYGSGLAMFLFAMTLYSEVSVGSVLGAGPVGVSVPGVPEQYSIPCHWGPTTGFVIFLIAFLLLLVALLLMVLQKKKGKEERLTLSSF